MAGSRAASRVNPTFERAYAASHVRIVDVTTAFGTFVPLSKTGAESPFEVLSQRHERGSTLVTSNLPFQEGSEVLGPWLIYREMI